MRISLMLADSAQISDGKVHALGLGWNSTVSPTPPMSVVLMLDVDWSSATTELDVVLELVDADGGPVLVEGPGGRQPLRAELHVQCSHAPQAPGSPTRVPFVANFGPGMVLSAGQRYQWRARVEGHGVAAEETFVITASMG